MFKKIVVIGPESTGKSSLSEWLAGHYKTGWVPEYAREYIDNLHREYVQDDLLQIAKGQVAAEEEMTPPEKQGLLFCDTDLYVIKVWSEHKYAACDPWILQQIARRKYDLYLLTYIDIPWTEDPQREYPGQDMREYFYHIYRDIVLNSGAPWADIRGSYAQRQDSAVKAVNDLLATNKMNA